MTPRADGPKQARATDKGRYYADPTTGASLISVTNVLDTCISKPALVPWAAKVTAEHIVNQLPHYVRAVRTDRDGALKEAKAQVRYVKDTAADLGTRVHARVEAHVLGTPYADDDEVEPFAEQAIAFFDAWGVDLTTQIEAAECTVANRTLGYAGTADLFVWLPTGAGGELQLWLVDYKTSSTRPVNSTYPEMGLQLAAYRHAEVIWLPDGQDAPVPQVAGTAILNLRTDKHAFIPMPADHEAAFAAFSSLLGAASYMHGAETKPAVMPAPTPELVGA